MTRTVGNPPGPKKAVIVGGGIIGLATAYALGREGVRATVLDPGVPQARASSATAGIIGGSSVIPWASSDLWPKLPSHLLQRDGPLRMAVPTPAGLAGFFRHSIRAGRPERRQASAAGLANLGLRGWDAWQTLLCDLPETRALFVQNGCLFYYPSPAHQAGDDKSNALRRGFGMDLTDLNAGDMQALLPPLVRSVAGGVRVNSAGHVVDPSGLQENLKAAILKQGGAFVAQKATGFMTSGPRVTAVTAGSAQYPADAVVLSAGSGAAALATGLGRNIPMIPAWGASVTFTDPEINLDIPFLVLSDGFAVTPSRLGLRVSGLLQVGGAGKAEGMKSTLIAQAKRLFGDFGHSGIISCAGPRPLTADSLPFLGPDPRYENLFHNFGHGHWGLTQAAISGQITTDLVLGRKCKIDISAYRPNRY